MTSFSCKNEYIDLLEATKKIIDDFDDKENKNGGSFNIFSILDKKNKELSHESFIYELINPKGSHKQGNLFLKIFLSEVLHLSDFDMHTLNITSEKSIFIDEEYKRLDLYLENNEYIIAIEMKIFSKERDGQLKSYKSYIEANKRNRKSRLYYLTLNGEKADSLEVNNYSTISFKLHIINWIDICIREIQHIPKLNVLLNQYREVLMGLTNSISSELKEELSNVLLINNNLKYAEELSEAIKISKCKKEKEFWNRLNNNLEEYLKNYGFERDITHDDFNINYMDILEKRYYDKKRNDVVGLSYKKNNIYFQVLQWNGYNFEIDIFIDNSRSKKQFIKALEHLSQLKNLDDKTGFYYELEKNISFMDSSFYQLFDEVFYNNFIIDITEEIKDLFSTILKQIKF